MPAFQWARVGETEQVLQTLGTRPHRAAQGAGSTAGLSTVAAGRRGSLVSVCGSLLPSLPSLSFIQIPSPPVPEWVPEVSDD